jgi:hypothetical protein
MGQQTVVTGKAGKGEPENHLPGPPWQASVLFGNFQSAQATTDVNEQSGKFWPDRLKCILDASPRG